MKPPVGLANEYARYLAKRYARLAEVDLTEGWERNPVHWSGRFDGTRRADASDFVNHAIARLIRIAEDNPVPEAHLQGLAEAVDKRNRRVVGVPTRAFAPGAPIANFRDANLALIKKLDAETVDDLRGVLEQAEREAWRVEQLKKEIADRFDVAKSHAELIARDQVMKLNGDITQYRQTSAGVTHYEWSTSGDERVRPMHDELDGTIQSWAEPPITTKDGQRNHPGQDIQCRCVAIPQI